MKTFVSPVIKLTSGATRTQWLTINPMLPFNYILSSVFVHNGEVRREKRYANWITLTGYGNSHNDFSRIETELLIMGYTEFNNN